MAIRWISGGYQVLGTPHALPKRCTTNLAKPEGVWDPLPWHCQGSGMDQGIPMSLWARGSPGTGFSSPQELTEHMKQRRGLSVGSGCFGCSEESRVWLWWDQGHCDSSSCSPSSIPTPPEIHPLFSHSSQGLEGCFPS